MKIQQLANQGQRNDVKDDEGDHHGNDNDVRVCVQPIFCTPLGGHLVAQIYVQHEIYLRYDVQQQYGRNRHHRAVKVRIVGFADACVEPHAMMVKVIHAFVAELAMHGFLGNFVVTYPAVLGWLVWIPRALVSIACMSMLMVRSIVNSLFIIMLQLLLLMVTVTGRMMQSRIGWIDRHCFDCKIRGCHACQCKQDGAWHGRFDHQQWRDEQIELYHQRGQRHPG
mmetsp:Transcript_10221/g.29126  ORF Transcript_10221/g.29126 Transcript_10221/m.29126 type:complete len:224 (+) Transcript_10221:193-864(+)